MKLSIVNKSLTAGIAVLIAAVPFASLPASAVAPQQASQEISIELNGYRIPLPDEAAPFMTKDRVQLPMRLLFEALGAQVEYDNSSKTITAVKDETTVTLQIAGSELKVGDRTIKLDSPALIANSRTFVPVRAVSEALGADVGWDQKAHTVRVSTPLMRVPAPAPESLEASVRESMKQRSASEQAMIAAYSLYSETIAVSPHIAAELLPQLDELRKSFPDFKRVWVREAGSRQVGDTFVFSYVITGQDAQGALREYAVDYVEVSVLSDKSGSIVTGYSHVQIPAMYPPGKIRIWIGSGENSGTPPADITLTLPQPLVKHGETMFPIEILKSFGTLSLAKDGTYTVILPGGESSEPLNAVTIQGHAYISLGQLIGAFDNKSVVVPGISTDNYSVHWNEAIRQLRIDIENYHPIS